MFEGIKKFGFGLMRLPKLADDSIDIPGQLPLFKQPLDTICSKVSNSHKSCHTANNKQHHGISHGDIIHDQITPRSTQKP